jgi:hypothetical protein
MNMNLALRIPLLVILLAAGPVFSGEDAPAMTSRTLIDEERGDVSCDGIEAQTIQNKDEWARFIEERGKGAGLGDAKIDFRKETVIVVLYSDAGSTVSLAKPRMTADGVVIDAAQTTVSPRAAVKKTHVYIVVVEKTKAAVSVTCSDTGEVLIDLK